MRAIVVFTVGIIGCSEPFTEDALVRTEHVETMSATPSCGAGWGARAESFAGIDGSFERVGPAADGELRTLAIFAVEEPRAGVVSEANAARLFQCGQTECPLETARASLLPEGTAMNPMILFSANGFNRTDPDMRGFYQVLGLERDDWGTITALCLQRFDEEGPPFLMARSD
jgi:hypothetical protein